MVYALENKMEWERLEAQSKLPEYDYRRELAGFTMPPGGTVLDAGCGSGVVSRYLAQTYPLAQVMGCDLSQDRITHNLESLKSESLPNLRFEVADLCHLPYPDQSLDRIICRYVLQHIPPEPRRAVMLEFYRCLKQGGLLHVIDFDGPLHNLFPQPPLVADVLAKIRDHSSLDLLIGRKLVSLLSEGGFSTITRKIETIDFQNESLIHEQELLQTRLSYALPFLTQLLGSEEKAKTFNKLFLSALEDPRAVYFYNKFLVTGEKSPRRRLAIVK